MSEARLEPLGDGIEIYVDDDFGFSTDTILLADFSRPVGRKKCVELGTGCGAVPLLWSRRGGEFEVFAVELQKRACELAEKSVRRNGLESRIKIINADLRKLKGVLPFGCFDAVVCNPPYKLSGGGIKSGGGPRLTARHENDCTLEDVCEAASRLLQFGGKLFICQRPERLADATELMRKYSIEPKTLRLVQQRKAKAPKLFLLEGRRSGGRGFLTVLPTLFIEDDSGGFSYEMMSIYGSYKERGEKI